MGQLRDLARLRAQQLPSLSMLIRYLDLSSKQDYLVKRILGKEWQGDEVHVHVVCVMTYSSVLIVELSEVGGIGNYRWDSGGSWKGRKWDHDLPNDSQVRVIINEDHHICIPFCTNLVHISQYYACIPITLCFVGLTKLNHFSKVL